MSVNYNEMSVGELRELVESLSDLADEKSEQELQKKQSELDAKRATALQEMNNLVQDAYDAINKAKEIADEYGASFDFSLAYGMGGFYSGRGNRDWDESSCSLEDVEGQWHHQ